MDFPTFFAGLRDVRRGLHTRPERSFEEYKTQAFLREYLIKEAQIPAKNIRGVAKTGLIVDIRGPQDGPKPSGPACIAFRADMDGLPMTEHNPHLDYSSKEAQCAHMCGHDGHMTSLLGFAVLINKRRHLLPPHSVVRLLFQPAEEGHFGAPAMIKDGCLDIVDEIYGYHNIPFPVGQIRVKPGPMMAHSARFTITINGPGGHGSAPHMTKDPIVVAGHVIMAIHTIVSRSVSPHESGVISITQIHGGEADNVIPSSVKLSGTMRDFSPDVFAVFQKRMRTIVTETSKAFEVEGTIEFRDGYAVVVNSPSQSAIVEEIAKNVVGDDNVSAEGLPICASEDFSYFLQQRPGCFFFIGTIDETESQNRTIHSDTFDFNDAILPLAVRLFVEILQHRVAATLFSKDELVSMQF
ncbi:hypothetical protein LEN26_003138 [Aphanomyces euteiches]|nr:hypothetical protein AeMF1_019496 [Aphanomyces euteiches]KAH9158066.1 hypothetical protein LEN26_003138 [Aphanomyces euteiches]KAH9183277.1 hypothetical protein AeNC1_014745 [Aphanomyces euteiches]